MTQMISGMDESSVVEANRHRRTNDRAGVWISLQICVHLRHLRFDSELAHKNTLIRRVGDRNVPPPF
jgi:hypothetical protein